MAFIETPGRTALQDVQAERPVIRRSCHDMPEHGPAQAFALMGGSHVKVFNPQRIRFRADCDHPGIHAIGMDHRGMFRLESLQETLADPHGIESSKALQVRAHHHRTKLGDPRRVGDYAGTKNEISHANQPMRSLPMTAASPKRP